MSIIKIKTPESFSYRFTIRSHGWYDLAPFELADDDRLSFVSRRGKNGEPVSVVVGPADGGLTVNVDAKDFDRDGVIRDVRHVLRLDEDFDEFYGFIEKTGHVLWVRKASAGRLLRGPTVWEDLVKTICTTNCSWSLTRSMVRNLVEKLGDETAGGKRAFPTPAAMASMPEAFYRDEIRAGYRSPYFVELAQSVANGSVDPESWLLSELPTPELKKAMKKVKGVGDYAAENLLKLVGRYDGLALDSWLRSGFYKKHNGGKICADKKIERHYRNFQEWRGLAIWCDMTESWFS